MPEPRQLKVFLCHSSSDKPVVRDLYQKLSAEGWIDPWLDEEKLYPGQDWNLEIEKAVEAADAILVCLSNHSITKEGYVQRELRIVLDYADYKPEGTLFLIPVRLEECEPPRRLRPWQYANYFPKEDRAKAYQRLLVSLRMRASGLGVEVAKPQKAPAQVKETERELESLEVGLPAEPEQVETTKGVLRGDVGRDGIPPHARPSREGAIIIGGMEFMLVPKGKFLMGSKDDDKDASDDEKPQHRVEIPYDYLMGRFTVTNEQFGRFVKSTGYKTIAEEKGSAWGYENGKDWKKITGANWQHPRGPKSGIQVKSDHPVVSLSWLDAMEYARWLTTDMQSILQADPRLSSLIFRLPTEAEWEKAARGVYGNIYPWGNDFDPKLCNSIESDKLDTAPVGVYPNGASPYGCEQMSGNVWEWTHTVWVSQYPYQANDGREAETSSDGRVVRGGSFHNDRETVCSISRNGSDPIHRYDDIGFRICLAPKLV